jgi:hypothetical protein
MGDDMATGSKPLGARPTAVMGVERDWVRSVVSARLFGDGPSRFGRYRVVDHLGSSRRNRSAAPGGLAWHHSPSLSPSTSSIAMNTASSISTAS